MRGSGIFHTSFPFVSLRLTVNSGMLEVIEKNKNKTTFSRKGKWKIRNRGESRDRRRREELVKQ